MLVTAAVLMLFVLLLLILKNNFLPGNIMALVPIAASLIMGTGFTETMDLARAGIEEAAPIAVMFIFAMLYFGVLSDAGMFEPVINRLLSVKTAGKSVFSVVAITAIIAALIQLDGQGLTTLIVIVPPMLIVFDKLKIRRIMMALIVCLVIGSMNMMPWSGPVVRAAAVIDMGIMELYIKLLPIQIAGVALSFAILYIASREEQKRGEFIPAVGGGIGAVRTSEAAKELQRPKLFWINLAITAMLVTTLFAGLPAYIVFLAGCAIVLPLNYRALQEQYNRVKAQAEKILISVYTIIGAGVLLGIMEGTGMFAALANAIVYIVPDSLSHLAPLMFGLLVTPLSFLLNSDAMIFGIMPVAVNIGARSGVSGATVAGMFISGRVIGSGLCLTAPAVYVGLSLMKIEYRDAFTFCFKWILALGIILVLLSAIIIH
jgi:CitMHS family citrate-Mg2+:H+ or citrate-Ca2+:H+ symporter